MKQLSKKSKVFILSFILIIISTLVIIINGNTYTMKLDNVKHISNIDELDISIENENIVKCTDKQLENGIVKIKLKAISKGKTFLNYKYSNGESFYINSIYVHNLGIITRNTYLGDCNGSIVIPISFEIWLI